MRSLVFNGLQQLHIGNGQGLSISHVSSSNITSPFNPNISLSLNQLLYIPHITRNLVNVFKMPRVM